MKKTICVLFAILFFQIISACKSEILTETSTHSLNPGINKLTILFDGLQRELIVQLPLSFQPDKIYPVVFYFHGLNGKKENSQLIFGPVVEAEEIIGVFPQGYLNSWNDGYNEVPSNANDVGFTLYILEKLKEEIKIDDNRIYSLGYSNGGAFSFYLAMKTDKFASIASLSASLFWDRTIPATTPKISVFQINGELDPVVPWEGGRSSYLPVTFKSALNTAKVWAAHNGLNDNPSLIEQRNDLTVYSFKEVTIPYEIKLYNLHQTTHDIGTHRYINSGQCNIDIWNFFKKHPKTGNN